MTAFIASHQVRREWMAEFIIGQELLLRVRKAGQQSPGLSVLRAQERGGMPFAIQEDEIGIEMSLQLQMEQMSGYLAARFTGAGVAEEGWRQFESIAEHCKRTKNNKLLIDGTQAEVKPSLVDRFLTAKRTLIFAQYGLKVAFVENPERIDPTRFGETDARSSRMPRPSYFFHRPARSRC
jgi:hypothetical protein